MANFNISYKNIRCNWNYGLSMKAQYYFATKFNILSHISICFTSKHPLSDSLQLLTIFSLAKRCTFYLQALLRIVSLMQSYSDAVQSARVLAGLSTAERAASHVAMQQRCRPFYKDDFGSKKYTPCFSNIFFNFCLLGSFTDFLKRLLASSCLPVCRPHRKTQVPMDGLS